MLDIKFIRENPDTVKNACRVKNFPDVVDDILSLDVRVRELKTITQTKTAEKNKISREIPTATDKAPLIAKSKQIGDEIANDLAELADKEALLNDLLHRVPQIPDASAPVPPVLSSRWTPRLPPSKHRQTTLSRKRAGQEKLWHIRRFPAQSAGCMSSASSPPFPSIRRHTLRNSAISRPCRPIQQ